MARKKTTKKNKTSSNKKKTSVSNKLTVKKTKSTSNKNKTARNKKRTKSETLDIRCTFEWDYLKDTLAHEQHNFSSKEKFYQHIDNLYEMGKVNQQDLLGSFNKLFNK